LPHEAKQQQVEQWEPENIDVESILHLLNDIRNTSRAQHPPCVVQLPESPAFAPSCRVPLDVLVSLAISDYIAVGQTGRVIGCHSWSTVSHGPVNM
jgi:hypothetical protein